MTFSFSSSFRSRRAARVAGAAALVLAVALPLPGAHAEDLLGLYLGAGVGQSQVSVDGGGFQVDSFRENHSAFKGIVGIRPIPVVGVEAEYVDFGHSTGTFDSPYDIKMKGAAAFAVGYLPLPVGDIFVKAGLSRLDSDVHPAGYSPACDPGPCLPGLFALSRTDTSFAAGAGYQFKLLSWAIRAEYENFRAAGGHTGLVTVGFTWTFL